MSEVKWLCMTRPSSIMADDGKNAEDLAKKEENEEKTEKSKPNGTKSLPQDLTNVGAQAKTAKTKFAVLKTLIDAVEVSDRDILDTVFNLVSDKALIIILMTV